MSTIYLIPTFLAEQAIETIPAYVMDAVKNCTVIFAENERTARRFLKSMDKSIIIDSFEWHTIHKVEGEQITNFKSAIAANKNIAIMSEAGCPGVADPGQELVAIAQQLNCNIKPLVGPNSILLALMASGMNGQQFEFIGYLPIDNSERIKKIKALRSSLKHLIEITNSSKVLSIMATIQHNYALPLTSLLQTKLLKPNRLQSGNKKNLNYRKNLPSF